MPSSVTNSDILSCKLSDKTLNGGPGYISLFYTNISGLSAFQIS